MSGPCRKALRSYKLQCEKPKQHLSTGTHLRFDPSLSRAQKAARLQASLRDFSRCRMGRENYRDRCVSEEEQDEGHQFQIDLMKQAENDTRETLAELARTPFSEPSREPESSPEPSPEPVRVPTACELAKDRRLVACRISSNHPLQDSLERRVLMERDLLEQELAELDVQWESCSAALQVEERECDTAPQEILEGRKIHQDLVGRYRSRQEEESKLIMTSFELLVRDLRAEIGKEMLLTLLTSLRTLTSIFNEKYSEQLEQVELPVVLQDFRRRVQRYDRSLTPLVLKVERHEELTLLDVGILLTIGLIRFCGAEELIVDEAKFILDTMKSFNPLLPIYASATMNLQVKNLPYGIPLVGPVAGKFAQDPGTALSHSESLIVLGLLQPTLKDYYRMALTK